MRKLSDALLRFSTTPVTLTGLIVFVLFTLLVLPRQATQVDATAAGAGSPDLSFFYAPADLYAWAEAYGPAGRAAYVQARATFDVIWPLLYTFFLVTALGWLVRRAGLTGIWRRAPLLPLAAALFDFLENAATSLTMLRYPAHTPFVDWLAPLFTAVKWTLVGACFLLLLGALIAAVRAGLQSRRK